VVAVLSGGGSGEREVSLRSGAGILSALSEPSGPQDRRGPRRALGVEIEPGGLWRLDGEELAPERALAALADVDVFFLGLHGGPGEDGTVQGLLESCGRHFTGSGVRASALCMDKLASRGVAEQAGLRVAPGVGFGSGAWSRSGPALLDRLLGLSERGWVVKPRGGGSSVSTFVVGRAGELAGRVEAVLARGDDALVEAFVPGIEVSCGVLGNRGGPLRALAPIEIVPAEGRFFDYQQKYDEAGAREICPPERLGPAVVERLRELAALAHEVTGCDGYSRSDFIVPVQGEEPVFLELNTLPGLTDRSLLPQEAAAEGLDYRSLCLEIVRLALEAPRGGGRR
jgi:D-alanine-D-alanine ligase